jgi:penicillin-binding protein 2
VNGDNPRLRLSILGIVAFSLFAALFARLWYLQVMAADQYNVAARANSTREVLVEAPRGRILDRNGKTVVDNRISVQVTIDRSAIGRLTAERREEVLGKVADALASTSNPQNVAQIEDRIKDQRFSPYVPVPIASDVPEQLKIWIDEHQAELPSVAAERVAVRDYPYGRSAAHVVGYTGKVTKDELDAVSPELQAAKQYTLNDEIGKYGVEKQYEEYLRGTPGRRLLEVDAEGNPIRVIEEDPPIPGDDLVLNLDIGVQAVAEQALKSGLDKASKRPSFGYDAANVGQVGSTVVLDPNNGGVLAMASYPSFAPADFVDGISESEWDFLNAKENHYPLNNWALQGQYAPGSTLKPFSAASGLAAGLLTPHTTIQDEGKYTIPNCKDERCDRFNDQRKKYGQVDLQRSLTVSSDVYYYGLGAQFWIHRDELGGPETFRTLLEQWGFFQKTQIDIPGERRGRIPSPKWKKEFCQEIKCVDDGWFTGDSVNAAVGQGDDLVTPLQLASAYATLGNGGTRWQPQVVQQILDGENHQVKKIIEPRQLGHVEVTPEGRQIIIEGLIGVTTREGGTAVGAFSGFENATFPVAAKTGTAQVSGKAPTAVFGAFGPATSPSFAMSVLMEESGYGGSAAAPVARRLFDVLSGSVPMPDPIETVQGPDLTELSPDPGDVRD